MSYLRYMINWIHAFLHDYEMLKNLAKLLIYIQISCSLIGSLDVMYNSMSLINLGSALVGSSAIAMNNRSLTRIYAVLIFFSVLVDVSWFVYSCYLESTTIFLFLILLKMEMVGFCIRFLLCLVWIQMYSISRLEGISHVATNSRRSNNDSDDDSGYCISNSCDANSSGDEDQQHNELEKEVQRLEMRRAQLLESIERKMHDLEQKKALNLQLKTLKLEMEKTKKSA